MAVALSPANRVLLDKIKEAIHTHYVAPMQERLAAEAERIARLERRLEAQELTQRLFDATERCYDHFPVGQGVRHQFAGYSGMVIPRPDGCDAEGTKGRLIWCLFHVVTDDRRHTDPLRPFTPHVVVRGCYPWNLTTTPSGVDRG